MRFKLGDNVTVASPKGDLSGTLVSVELVEGIALGAAGAFKGVRLRLRDEAGIRRWTPTLTQVTTVVTLEAE